MKIELPWSDRISEEVDSVDVILKNGSVLTIQEEQIVGVSVDLKRVTHTPMDRIIGGDPCHR